MNWLPDSYENWSAPEWIAVGGIMFDVSFAAFLMLAL